MIKINARENEKMRITEELNKLGGVASANVVQLFLDLVAKGVKEFEMTEKEFRCWLNVYHDQLNSEKNLVGGTLFTFWGIKIKVLRNARENKN